MSPLQLGPSFLVGALHLVSYVVMQMGLFLSFYYFSTLAFDDFTCGKGLFESTIDANLFDTAANEHGHDFEDHICAHCNLCLDPPVSFEYNSKFNASYFYF